VLGKDDIFGDDEMGADMLGEEDDIASVFTGSAYVEMLRYASCLVPFEDRVIVFQELILRDRQVIVSR
jgi:hypothetical protein